MKNSSLIPVIIPENVNANALKDLYVDACKVNGIPVSKDGVPTSFSIGMDHGYLLDGRLSRTPDYMKAASFTLDLDNDESWEKFAHLVNTHRRHTWTIVPASYHLA